MTPDNQDRADWAEGALDTFTLITFRRHAKEAIKDEGDTVVIGDLLCNLMHFCQQNDIEFVDCLTAGQRHFDYEIKHPYE